MRSLYKPLVIQHKNWTWVCKEKELEDDHHTKKNQPPMKKFMIRSIHVPYECSAITLILLVAWQAKKHIK